MRLCTLTPGEVSTLLKLIKNSSFCIDYSTCENIEKGTDETLFDEKLIDIKDNFINEAQLEFTILASLKPFYDFLSDDYILCRQVPISPFKPMDMDRADICLYSMENPIKDGTIPNVVIELKRGCANFHAYEQAVRYLKWIDRITTDEEFSNVQTFVIANSFNKIRKEKVDTCYEDKIKVFSLDKFKFEHLVLILTLTGDSNMENKKIKKWEPEDFELEMTTHWSFPKRGDWATHDAKWRGNWSPYIPRNIILRYSQEGDLVLDQFAGGGTTLVEKTF